MADLCQALAGQASLDHELRAATLVLSEGLQQATNWSSFSSRIKTQGQYNM